MSANIFSARFLVVVETLLDFVAARTGTIPEGFFMAQPGAKDMAISTGTKKDEQRNMVHVVLVEHRQRDGPKVKLSTVAPFSSKSFE